MIILLRDMVDGVTVKRKGEKVSFNKDRENYLIKIGAAEKVAKEPIKTKEEKTTKRKTK